MSSQNALIAVNNRTFNLLDELIYLRSIVVSATNQLKKICSEDVQLFDLVNDLIILNNDNSKEHT